MRLSEKQKRFADYFVELGDATEAYLRAGYKVKSRDVAKVNASRLLTNANVKTHIESRIAEKDAARIAKQDEVLEFLTSVLRGQVKEQFPLGLGMGEQSLVKKELDGKDRIKAAELLGKRYGMFKDNVNIEGSAIVQIIDDLGSGKHGD
ncbi:terminase small subunit [Paenibacillus alkaliterrae]|uniref:terminase small subunit n=1 Tax=Paenibacillus alkaliterrae TaxID=320909 RepID=UPI001F28B287|nr:terminase small subunit [Paenibacillus alkaliterrae]MCF2939032.1 terminase small subunit [Paenibacillus alkaliterrae]